MTGIVHKPRLGYLYAMRDGLEARLIECSSDQNYAVLTRELRSVLLEIDDLGGGEKPQPKETGLSDFETRLREREAATKAPRSAKSS